MIPLVVHVRREAVRNTNIFDSPLPRVIGAGPMKGYWVLTLEAQAARQ